MDVEWFYVDGAGSQHGPVNIGELKTAWSSGGLTDASLVWNGNMSGWQTVDATTELKKQLQPAGAAAAPAGQAAVPAPAPRPQMNLGGGLGASIAAAAAGLKKGQSGNTNALVSRVASVT